MAEDPLFRSAHLHPSKLPSWVSTIEIALNSFWQRKKLCAVISAHESGGTWLAVHFHELIMAELIFARLPQRKCLSHESWLTLNKIGWRKKCNVDACHNDVSIQCQLNTHLLDGWENAWGTRANRIVSACRSIRLPTEWNWSRAFSLGTLNVRGSKPKMREFQQVQHIYQLSVISGIWEPAGLFGSN